MDKQQKTQEIINKVLLTIIRDNKGVFDQLSDEDLEKKVVIECLARSINKNGGVDYLRTILRDII